MSSPWNTSNHEIAYWLAEANIIGQLRDAGAEESEIQFTRQLLAEKFIATDLSPAEQRELTTELSDWLDMLSDEYDEDIEFDWADWREEYEMATA